MVSGFDSVNEVCDDKSLDKMLGAGLINAHSVAGDGLFTSRTQEPSWTKAHDILPQLQRAGHQSLLLPDDDGRRHAAG